MHEVSALLDYGTKSEKQAFLYGFTALDTKFDVTAAATVDFVHDIKCRAKNSGWDAGTYDIINLNIVSTNTGTVPIMKSLFIEYGQIPVSVLKTACEDWQTGNKKSDVEFQCYVRAKDDDYMAHMPYHDGLTHVQMIQIMIDH